jgi:TPR repeat protein
VALLYEQGRGVPKRQSIAMKWYRLAGQQGHIAAQLALGLIYDEGRGVPQNDWQAEKWYRLAAEKGDPTAQMNLGLLYSQGRGISRDYVQAYIWLSLASATGHANAAKQRDAISAQMTGEQLAEAEKLASAWSLILGQAKARCRGANLPPYSC